jgi:hypothetical protein
MGHKALCPSKYLLYLKTQPAEEPLPPGYPVSYTLNDPRMFAVTAPPDLELFIVISTVAAALRTGGAEFAGSLLV